MALRLLAAAVLRGNAVVKSFLSLYPDIQICVNVGEATRMYHLVMKNALDFVIAEVVDDISGLSHHSIQHFPVVAVCHRSNPLAEKAVVTAPELAREHLLLRELGSHTRSGVDTYFQTHNLTVVPMWESYSVQSLLNAATEATHSFCLEAAYCIPCFVATRNKEVDNSLTIRSCKVLKAI